MSNHIKFSINSNKIERIFVSFILFYSAFALCLPVPVTGSEGELYPWWSRIIAVGNVVIHELVFILWIVLFGLNFYTKLLYKKIVQKRSFPTRQAAIFMTALAIVCGVSSISSPLPLLDFGRTLRLLLNVALLFAVVEWTIKWGNFPLRMLVYGFLAGTMVNLIISFKYPLIINGLMRLCGQNTPGVVMAIALHMTAWLFYNSKRYHDQVLSLITALICAFGCGISYSRIGWFVGGFGCIAWAYILIVARPNRRIDRWLLKIKRKRWLPLIVLLVVVLMLSPIGQKTLNMVLALIDEKLFSDRSLSVDYCRWAYFIGVAQILMDHPFGVGYTGFFDAMTSTEIYISGRALPEVSYDANPHSSFLWYASAGGIPGAVIAVILFFLLLNSMRVGLKNSLGKSGVKLFTLVVLPYLLIGLTVPYLFNSMILIVPTAIAAGWGWKQFVDKY